MKKAGNQDCVEAAACSRKLSECQPQISVSAPETAPLQFSNGSTTQPLIPITHVSLPSHLLLAEFLEMRVATQRVPFRVEPKKRWRKGINIRNRQEMLQ